MPRNEELSLSSLGIQMPYNMQAEQSVLGAALMDETVLNRLITDMEPEMFYSDQNRAVYETMRSLYTESEAVDLITLVNALGNNGTFAGADDAKVYVTHLAETVPAISNVDSYLKIVREKYQARRLIEAARSILSETSSGEDADMLLESAEQQLGDKINFVKVDVDEQQQLAAEFDIMSIPTLVVFKDGKPVKRMSGYRPLDTFVEELKSAVES